MAKKNGKKNMAYFCENRKNQAESREFI